MLVFEERRKPEYLDKNLLEQTRSRINNKLNPHMLKVHASPTSLETLLESQRFGYIFAILA